MESTPQKLGDIRSKFEKNGPKEDINRPKEDINRHVRVQTSTALSSDTVIHPARFRLAPRDTSTAAQFDLMKQKAAVVERFAVGDGDGLSEEERKASTLEREIEALPKNSVIERLKMFQGQHSSREALTKPKQFVRRTESASRVEASLYAPVKIKRSLPPPRPPPPIPKKSDVLFDRSPAQQRHLVNNVNISVGKLLPTIPVNRTLSRSSEFLSTTTTVSSPSHSPIASWSPSPTDFPIPPTRRPKTDDREQMVCVSSNNSSARVRSAAELEEVSEPRFVSLNASASKHCSRTRVSNSSASSVSHPPSYPPPKPPRTFAHDEYVRKKQIKALPPVPPPTISFDSSEPIQVAAASLPAPVSSPAPADDDGMREKPVYELYDVSARPHSYERPDNCRSPSGRRRAELPLYRPNLSPKPSAIVPGGYETLSFDSEAAPLSNRTCFSEYSTISNSMTSSLRSQRSVSDECLYSKPYSKLTTSGYSLTKPLPLPWTKLSAASNIHFDDGAYALPSDDYEPVVVSGQQRPLEVQRSRSVEKLDANIPVKTTVLDFERLKRNIQGQLGRHPDVKRDGETKKSDTGENVKIYKEVRHKLEQAYSVLRYRACDMPDGGDSDDQSDESDSQIDLSELQRRIQHVSAMREKSRSVYEKIRLFKDNLYPSLFEYAVIIRLRLVDNTCLPEILFKFPHFVNVETTCITDFCFPDRDLWLPVLNYDSETFWFVFTRQDGSRDYGYCRRLLPLSKQEPRLPFVVCIVSPHRAHSLYTKVLDEVEKRLHHCQDQAEELLQAVYAKPLPGPGRHIQVKTMNTRGIAEMLYFNREADSRLENVNFDTLFSCLSIENVIKVFSSVLLERRILFGAQKLSTLTDCIHVLVSLLYPLQWEHTFIPVLPPTMLEITCSPTPYIIGVLSVHLSDVDDLPTEDVLIVDLDTDKLRSETNDELSIIPKKLQKALTTVIKMALNDSESPNHKHLMLSEAFLRLFVESIGHYGDHVLTQQDGERVFVKESFCKAVSSKSLRMFLEWLSESHLFQLFIVEQLAPDKTSLGLFDKRVIEHRDNLASMPPSPWNNFRQMMKKMGQALKTNIIGPGELKKK